MYKNVELINNFLKAFFKTFSSLYENYRKINIKNRKEKKTPTLRELLSQRCHYPTLLCPLYESFQPDKISIRR
jgi:hypothetical protein